MAQRELYVAAIEHKPDDAEAYYNLGLCLSADETVTLADGRVMTERELYVAAIEHKPDYAEAYCNLGVCLSADETVTLADGRVMTQRELYVEAVTCDAKNATAFYNLSQTISPSSALSIVANGRTFTREGCLLEAYQLDPKAAIGAAAANRLRSARVTFLVPDAAELMMMSFTLVDSCDLVLSLLDTIGLIRPDSHITLRDVDYSLTPGKNLAECGFVEGAYDVEVVRNSAPSSFDPSRSEVAVIPSSDLRFMECLSHGGFGEVWKAECQGRVVAVKKPFLHVSGGDLCSRRELSIITSIPPHPNIIGFVARVTPDSGGPDWVVLEYADRSLRQATSSSTSPHRCNEAFIVSIARQLCSALQHLHARRVYHLDLKPDNVLLIGDAVKLCDFGLSRLYEPGAKSRVISKEMGTPNFSAPEQFDAEVGTLSAHSDVYGFGATLWASVTGEAPWAGLQLVQIVTQMVKGRPCQAPLKAHPDCGCSPPLNSLIEWCMKLSPADRPTLDQVAAALHAMTCPSE